MGCMEFPLQNLTVCILMDFRIHIDTIRDCPFCILRGHWYKFLNYDVFLFIKVVLILGLAQEKV